MRARPPTDALTEHLVLGAQAGDRKALTTLYEIWSPRLLRHAGRLTDDPHAAADAAQEAWIAIARTLPRLDDPAAFIPWAYRIVANKAADTTRRKQRDRRLVRDAANDPPPDSHADPEADPEIDQLRRALRRLDPDRRALLAMRHVDGLSVAQIAAALAVPIGTVKSRLHAARAELRAIIEGDSQ